MPRYIDAEREIKEIETVLEAKRIKGDDEHSIGFYALMQFASMLRKAPTADVAPVVHAHWVNQRHDNRLEHKCSNCHVYTLVDDKEYQYCPICGAKMDKGD